jgi:uncharacterized protein YcbK (DUF882 family)
MLDVKTRQKYLKALGFYKGNIDGDAGKLTKAAYLKLQKKYFKRKEDIDGIYGRDTDILLQNAYKVKIYCKSFKLTEFRCKCNGDCTGYPVVLDTQLLKNIQALRNKYGSTNISSGMRCEKHNARVGGSKNSRHKLGKALDIKNRTSKKESGRRAIMSFWRTLPKERYTYCNIGGNYPNMGTAVHVDVE